MLSENTEVLHYGGDCIKARLGEEISLLSTASTQQEDNCTWTLGSWSRSWRSLGSWKMNLESSQENYYLPKPVVTAGSHTEDSFWLSWASAPNWKNWTYIQNSGCKETRTLKNKSFWPFQKEGRWNEKLRSNLLYTCFFI